MQEALTQGGENFTGHLTSICSCAYCGAMAQGSALSNSVIFFFSSLINGLSALDCHLVFSGAKCKMLINHSFC